ncbi:MAG: phosphohistidine phosphatase SixA [Thermodesulfobacteriota bacterium]
MELYLMQHGHALSKDEDPERALSMHGEAQARLTGRLFKMMGMVFDSILSSPKKRSRQTAAIVAEETGFPIKEIIETERVKAKTPPEETVRGLAELSGAQRVLIAGHLPSVGNLAAYLLTEQASPFIHFEPGVCCRIQVDDLSAHSGELHWLLTPDLLEYLT